MTPDATVLLRRHKSFLKRRLQNRLMNVLFPRIPLWDVDSFLVPVDADREAVPERVRDDAVAGGGDLGFGDGVAEVGCGSAEARRPKKFDLIEELAVVCG